MPEQVYQVTGTFPSGKEKTLKVKLVNFRADPDDPADQKRIFDTIQLLTPPAFDVKEGSIQLLHDDPEAPGANSLKELVARPASLSTETMRTNPVTGGKTK